MTDKPASRLNIRNSGTVSRGGRRRRSVTTADSAAVILSMTAGAPGDGELQELAQALRSSLTGRALTDALDEAASRVVRLIDLCVATRPAG